MTAMRKNAAHKPGAGVLFVCLDDNSVLLLKRSRYVSEPGTWGVPGGTTEPKEEASQTAYRETKEELGTFPQNIRPIQAIVNNSFTLFIVEIPREDKELWSKTIKLNWEHDTFNWFKLNSIPGTLHPAIDFIKT